MRPLVAAALGATLVLSTAVPALAHPNVELAPTLPTDVTHARTDNLDYLGRFPEHAGTAGGRLVGDTFFITDPRGVFAYDVSDPATPELLGALPLAQSYTGAALAQEDPDSDGRILLVDAATPTKPLNILHVVDVSDPAAMTVLATAPVKDHTWTCVSAGDNGCAYAYGRSGWIVDLTEPTAPQVLELGWREAADFGGTGSNSPYTHDLTEIRPGLVMTSGIANLLLDTTDPAKPVLLNTLDQSDRFTWGLGYHSVEWAQGGTAPVAVFGTEIAPDGSTNLAGSDCQSENSVIETWDATEVVAALAAYEADPERDPAVVRAAQFTLIDSFDVSGRGLFVDGDAPAHVLYCAHWMEP
ncbi:MAG: hypothetical protein KY461_14980, partial [Actinobacteria bacterium]|nr:hypothetical protein [Actinomycetota bacterium]